MRKTIAIALGAALAAAPAVALAQQSTGGGSSAGQVQPAQQKLDTKTFLRMAASGNQFEIRSSELARKHAQNAAVKRFAERMITDHQAAEDRMKTMLASAKMESSMPASGKMDAQHQKMFDALEKKTKNFDTAYVHDQVLAHQQTVQLFNSYAENGDNEDVRNFARDMLPTLKDHLAEAQKLPGAAMDATGSTVREPKSEESGGRTGSGYKEPMRQE